MQWRRFYGHTLAGALAQVKRELGPDALILETRPVQAGSPEARLNPGARYEVCAVRDGGCAVEATGTRESAQSSGAVGSQRLLDDLAVLRSQIRELLEGDLDSRKETEAGRDLIEYQELLDLGIDHRMLAPHFRNWLQWRTASPAIRRYLAQGGSPAGRMRGENLREWLWQAWMVRQDLGGLPEAAENRISGDAGKGPEVVALVGPGGSGKTTTLAKLASINRRKYGKRAAILTLDTRRIGTEGHWRRLAKLMDVSLEEVLTQADLSSCMERWGQYDWIGIDTPGGMRGQDETGRLYGALLAQYASMKTALVLPVAYQDAAGREQMKRYGEFNARRVLFSKLDETERRGGIVNLTMDGEWKIDSLTHGTRVPEDWTAANGESLWRWVLAPGTKDEWGTMP